MKQLLLTFSMLIFLLTHVLQGQDSIRILMKEALNNVKEGQCKEAVDKFQKVTNSTNDSMVLKTAYIFSSQCLRKLGKFNESLTAINKAIAIDPNDVASYFDRIHTLDAMKDYREMETECKRIFKMKIDAENKSYCYYYLGKSFGFRKMWSDAIKNFNKAVELNQTDELIYFYRGFALQQKGDFAEAISDYSQAIVLDSTFGEAYKYRGVTRINKITKEYEGTYISIFGKEACADLKKAKELGVDVDEEYYKVYCK